MMTSRELVYATLEGQNTSGRIPRQIWTLPWAWDNHGGMLRQLLADYPEDIGSAPAVCREVPRTVGNPYAVGEYVDEWGCRFTNIHKGIIGEVKDPLIPSEDDGWDNRNHIHIPEELLTFDVDAVNRHCAGSDRFILGGCCPRPFERLQFIRGTENLYMDLLDPPAGMQEFMRQLHDFYCRLLTAWAKTDIDALNIMDDWGAQNSLLIRPDLWRELFRPLYRDYIDIAHSYGKKIFMHSDGYTLDILPDLAELGLDAINAQVLCIGLDKLASFRGKITFWGEIDRQHILPEGTEEDVRRAVGDYCRTFWQDGKCIAQLEFGPGARPDNVRTAYEAFDRFVSDTGDNVSSKI